MSPTHQISVMSGDCEYSEARPHSLRYDHVIGRVAHDRGVVVNVRHVDHGHCDRVAHGRFVGLRRLRDVQGRIMEVGGIWPIRGELWK